MDRARLLSAVLLLSISSAIARAELPARLPEPNTYGVATENVVALTPWAFKARNQQAAQSLQGNSLWRYCTASCFLFAPLNLPAGAAITRGELDACDFSSTLGAVVSVALWRSGRLEQDAGGLGAAATGVAPGCTTLQLGVIPHTVDNVNNQYWVEVAIQIGGDPKLRFTAARIYYTLQVRQAPATATFSDVPASHPFHQYIEALAAAGITAGCTVPPNPQFCPDAPLTRGQMAVFLARALGLHWVP